MDNQKELLELVQETFNEQEVLEIALYILSAQAVTEAAQQGIMGGYKEVRGLPPQALDLAYKYDSALTTNEFFLKHYTVIRAFTVMDKIRLSASGRLAAVAEREKDKNLFKSLEHTMYAKMDSLVILAFLWKGYDFAVDFMMKMRSKVDLPDDMKKYFDEKLR